MKLLAIVLMIISASKLALCASVEKDDFKRIPFVGASEIEGFYKVMLPILILDGLVGLFCGLYIHFTL